MTLKSTELSIQEALLQSDLQHQTCTEILTVQLFRTLRWNRVPIWMPKPGGRPPDSATVTSSITWRKRTIYA